MRTRGLLAAALTLLCGCTRSRITTEIKADGSWVRTVTLTGQEKKEGMQVPTLEDTFVIPSGPGWKSRQEKTAQDRSVILERVLAAGDTIEGDLSIKDEKSPSKLQLVNKVTVSRVGPRLFEYRETLRWKGGPPESLNITADETAGIVASLPKPLATEANARALAQKVAALAIPMMFGPGDPLLPLILFHPDLAQRQMSQRIGPLMLKALEDQFGDKMQPAERREVLRKLIASRVSSTRPSQPQPDVAPGPSSDKSSTLVPLMFIVKTPGRVVSSNGEVDEFSGEVFWGLYPEAASIKDLVLTAVCEVEPR